MATLQDVVNRYVSWEGRFWYGMEGNISDPSWGRLNPVASGYGDCSSTIWRAFWDVLGVDIGRWTGEQRYKGTRLFTGSYRGGWDPSKLVPGDLVLMGPDMGSITHVEMYVGNGQFSGHGGEIEPGPWRKSAADYLGRWPYWEARRYAAPSTGSSTSSSAVGTILGGISKMKATHIIFQSGKGLYMAHILAGTYQHIPNPQALKDQQAVARIAGGKVATWQALVGAKNNVANPQAFGRKI